MTKTFSYSLLQYKHSRLTREAINIGVLYAFHDDNTLELILGNAYRVRSIYIDFDPSLYNASLNSIKDRVRIESNNSLFKELNVKGNFHQFINNRLLRDDATALQFTEPIIGVINKDKATTVRNYTKLLLNGIDEKKQEVERHNEAFLIRTFKNYLLEGHKHLEKKIEKNYQVNYDNHNFQFDLAWQNGTTNLIKSVSFDLKEKHAIFDKSVSCFGSLTLLKDYASEHNCRFDILIAKPREPKLKREYEKAVDTLRKIKADKRIIKENEIKDYSQETIDSLSKH